MGESMRRPRVGELVVYVTTFTEDVRQCEVTAVLDDVKNGYPGFDGVTPGGFACWGYDDQIVDYPKISKGGAVIMTGCGGRLRWGSDL